MTNNNISLFLFIHYRTKQNMSRYILTISLLLGCILIYGQNGEKLRDHFEENSKHLENYSGLEMGFNITNVLTRFVGNQPGIDAFDFPFLFRYHFKKNALRIGLGASFDRNSFFDPTTATFRETEDRSMQASIGLERSVNIKKRLAFYYGVDFFAASEFESVKTSNFNNSTISKDIIRFGTSPFIGFSYSINHRVRLHTETNISGFYEKTNTTDTLNGVDTPIAETDRLGGKIEPPIALFINLKF